jgi:hypothetical protein
MLKEKFLKLISNSKIIFGVYILLSFISALAKYFRGPHAYNNYLLFKNVFLSSLKQQNIFQQHPDLFFDANHYGVFFGILIAPFALLPDWLGMPLWNVANALVFVFALSKLPISNIKKSFVGWLCLQEFITAAVSVQFNIALTGLLILSMVYIYEQKETKSALAILVGFFVKIYGIVGLSGFFFVKNKFKFILSFVVIFILFLILPMLYSSAHFGLQSYRDWYVSLSGKNIENESLTSMQDFSIMGIVRRIVGDASISNLYFLVPGLVIFAMPYLRIKQYKEVAFQLMILCSTLLFLVLFSSSSESPTYIIAVTGVMIWFIIQKEKTPLVLFLLFFVLIFTCFSTSDLFPKYIKDNFIQKYSLKALPCVLVWFRIIYELMIKDFAKDYCLK